MSEEWHSLSIVFGAVACLSILAGIISAAVTKYYCAHPPDPFFGCIETDIVIVHPYLVYVLPSAALATIGIVGALLVRRREESASIDESDRLTKMESFRASNPLSQACKQCGQPLPSGISFCPMCGIPQ